MESGFGEVVFAAMGQAFFTLSLGIGALAIFGSYIGKDRSLMGESINVAVLDTMVAFMAGLIIFPACSAFGINPGEGPGLIFVTLPNVFNHMAGGRVWGSSVLYLYDLCSPDYNYCGNLRISLSFAKDLWGWSRKKATLVNIVLIIVLSLPAVLAIICSALFSRWEMEVPFWTWRTLLSATTSCRWVHWFICCSASIVMVGAGIILSGKQIPETVSSSPKWARGYVTYLLPLIVLYIFVQGYIAKFF